MTPECQRARVPRTWLALPFIGGVVLAFIGFWPTRAWCESGGVQAMLAALILVLAIVYVTLVPAMLRMATADAPGRLKVGFRTATVRFLLTLVLAALVAWRIEVERQVFLVWVAIAYVVMIQCETLVLVRWARLLERTSCS